MMPQVLLSPHAHDKNLVMWHSEQAILECFNSQTLQPSDMQLSQ